MVLLRKLFASVRSFLIGTLHNLDEAVVQRRYVISILYSSPRDRDEALRILAERIGVEHMSVFAQDERSAIVYAKATQIKLHSALDEASHLVTIDGKLASASGDATTSSRATSNP